MSSIDVQGNKNRIAGRDYIERYELHEHYYDRTEKISDRNLSDEELSVKLELSEKDNHKAQLRKIANPIFSMMVTLFALAVMSLGVILSDFFSLFREGHAWKLLLPLSLLLAMFLVSLFGKKKLDRVRREALVAKKRLNDIENEIARRKYR